MKKSKLSKALERLVGARQQDPPVQPEDCSWANQPGGSIREKKKNCLKCTDRNKALCVSKCDRDHPPGTARAVCKRVCVCEHCEEKNSKCGQRVNCKRSCLGACCEKDGPCKSTLEEDCLKLRNKFHGVGTKCSQVDC